jgi:hypothetical protein
MSLILVTCRMAGFGLAFLIVNMTSRLLWACLCLPALLISCGRQTEGPPANTPAATAPKSPRAPQGMSAAPATPSTIADNADTNVILQQLTQALRDYVVRTRTVPKNFEEFALKSNARFPAAPAGKKYAIQGQEVVLVKS